MVELRAGGDPHRPEKSGWSASDIRQWEKKRFIVGWEARGDLWLGMTSRKSTGAAQ